MKSQPYIIIRCIASNDINVQELALNLENHIKKYFPDAQLVLEANEPYWKDPKSNSIIYSIVNNQNIKIANLITLFSLSWEYSEGYVYNLEIQKRVDKEDAIWSQLCYPREVFLNSLVDWVHIYTTERVQDPIIN